MRRAMKQSLTILLTIIICASVAGAAAMIGENKPTTSPITLADQPKKIEVPVTINGVTITPGTSPAFQSGDTISFSGPTSLTINGRKLTIGSASDVKILPSGAIVGKTGSKFQAGAFKQGQIPDGVSFKLLNVPSGDSIEFGSDSEGKQFHHPRIGKFKPSFSGTTKKLTLDANEAYPDKVTVGIEGKLTTIISKGRTLQLENKGVHTVEFSSDNQGNPQIAGGSINKVQLDLGAGSSTAITLKDGGVFSVLPNNKLLLTLGEALLSEEKVAIDTNKGKASKIIAESPDGSTTVKAANPSEGVETLAKIGIDLKQAIKDAATEKAVELSNAGREAFALVITPAGSEQKPEPGEILINSKTGGVAINPSKAQVIAKLDKAVVAATGDGDLKFNIDDINDKKLNIDFGKLKLQDGTFDSPRLPDSDLTALIGTDRKAAAKVNNGAVSKSANPSATPPAPVAAKSPTSSDSELNDWYASKTGKIREDNFLKALDNLPNKKQAESWKSAIQNRDYTTIKQIQTQIGTGVDGKLGGGSLRALNSYVSMSAPVTEDDKPEPISGRTTPVTPAKRPAAPSAAAQPDQSPLGIRIAESRQRQAAMINALPSNVRQAAESGGIPISEITTRLGRPTQTREIAIKEPTDTEEIESLKFSGTLTQDQKRFTRNAYGAQQAEKMKVTHSTINPTLARLPTVKISEAPKNAQAGDALMRPEGRATFTWLKYNRDTGKYIDQSSEQTYTPLQVATRDSRIIR
ncbi:MAG: hypothetical protein AABX47_07415 [Nanoarchaeota archaeon]